ncbi:hypothetical protein [Bradyrhizobium manausense]|uniref:DUF2630 domain-containing protein n=1 Tax=Bradyrhizobium manausense TaxID=989370 RepID=A0A0R3E6D9_9BRAD|nr:hypothetical protein [Bradyrhizobium manausense]KRQ17664.1 hypothetical protein AOQ71_01375 [Bradyrhizobium manausense]
MGIELKQETLAKLRNQLGREPTDAEVRAARDELLRRHYAAMLTTEMMLRDEADEFSPRSSK